MKPTDLDQYVTIESVDVSPDGSTVVYGQARMDLDADRYHRVLMLAGASIRPLTDGPSDRRPRWSPDGSKIAFLRGVEESDQLALVAPHGGDVEIITSFAHKVVAFEWAPDSRRLVVQVPEQIDDPHLTDEERKVRPRRITSIPYRFDDPRWEGGTADQLWVVESGVEPRQITTGTGSCEGPVWAPDGAQIAFRSDRSGRRFGTTSQHLCVVDAGGGPIVAMSELGSFSHVTYRPDGVLHAVGLVDEFEWPAPLQLLRLEPDGLAPVAPDLDRTISLADGGFGWDGDAAVCVIDDGGRNVAVRIDPDGSVARVYDEQAAIKALASSGSVVAAVASTYADPGHVVAIDGTEQRVIAQPNADLDLGLVAGDYFQVSANGVEIDAWAYLPPGDDRVPLLLNIHGGPAGQYGFGFFDEFQVYASAGYGVVACNPRGSAGRGREWLRAVTGGGWGVNDMADVQAVVAAAAARHPRLDVTRKGIMGGSYGGFLTAWITAHDQSFRAAVVERALLNWTSFTGTSDISSAFSGMYLAGATTPRDHETLWAASPLRLADEITTPTLLVHAEGDYRCPIEQAEQFFFVLLKNGVDAEFLRFPGESHEMSRAGKPQHRLARFEAILEWHQRHLA